MPGKFRDEIQLKFDLSDAEETALIGGSPVWLQFKLPGETHVGDVVTVVGSAKTYAARVEEERPSPAPATSDKLPHSERVEPEGVHPNVDYRISYIREIEQ